MRRISLSVLALLVLLGAQLAPAYSRVGAERHPLIRPAMAALQAARTDLQNAAHDYCGHRLEALEATNAAINQLQQALACDSRKGNSQVSEIEAPAEPGWAGGEPHPNINRAINALGAAESDLQDAAHDYCGHRVAALEAIQNALARLRLAIQCDKK